VRVQCTDPRVAGQLLIIADGAFNADGTATLQGTSYMQVGTWDAAGTNFTPTGGMWQGTWRGEEQADYSLQLSIEAYGVGGTVDGLRVEETLTRAPDQTAPYVYAGTIKPPPVSTTLASDDFSGGVHGWSSETGSGTVTLLPSNQQMTIHAQFPRPASTNAITTLAWGSRDRAWMLNDGQTIELRVDLVNLNEAATLALLGFFGSGGTYTFGIGHDYLDINKHTSGLAVLRADRVTIKTNVVASLALTRAEKNVLLTARVLDKDNQNAVIYERTVLDTPASDPTVSHTQFSAIAGFDLTDLSADPAGAPYTSGSKVFLAVWQATDGTRPAAEATFDNFTLRLSDVPPLNITRAVQLAWPAPAGLNYTVEAAPAVNGPWLPIQNLEIPGIQNQTVPLSGPAQFFRLVEAP
jgi:hypothetical protein